METLDLKMLCFGLEKRLWGGTHHLMATKPLFHQAAGVGAVICVT